MSYSKFHLSTISKMNTVFEKDVRRFSLWTYKSDVDDLEVIFTPGYFDEALFGLRGTPIAKSGVITIDDVLLIQEIDGTVLAHAIIFDDGGVATLRRVTAFTFQEVVIGASSQTTFVIPVANMLAGTNALASINTSTATGIAIVGVDNSVANQITITLAGGYTGDITFTVSIG